MKLEKDNDFQSKVNVTGSCFIAWIKINLAKQEDKYNSFVDNWQILHMLPNYFLLWLLFYIILDGVSYFPWYPMPRVLMWFDVNLFVFHTQSFREMIVVIVFCCMVA